MSNRERRGGGGLFVGADPTNKETCEGVARHNFSSGIRSKSDERINEAERSEGGKGFYTAYATIRRFDTHHLTPACASASLNPKEIYSFASFIFGPRYCVCASSPSRDSHHQSQLCRSAEVQQQKEQPKDQQKEQPKQRPDKGWFTAEQIVRVVIIVYGTRPALEQIRRNGVERGQVTRNMPEGATEETNYERRFVRGENLDKDKIRLDQRLPTMEYSLIYGGGKMWGLINGTAFTPREDTAASFMSQHHHSLDTLLRYKESGSTLNLVRQGDSKRAWISTSSTSKTKRNERLGFTSAPKPCVFFGWSMKKRQYEGAAPVKYMKKFMDYRVVQQTLVPYRTVLLEDGRQSQETRLLTITYGVKVDDSIFKNPEA